MYYASFGMLAIVLHIIINFETIKKLNEGVPQHIYRYRHFLYSLLLYYFADVLWGFLYDARIVPVVYADTVLYFVAMALSVLLWSRFVVSYLKRNDKIGKTITHAGALIFVYVLASLAVNLLVPVFFAFAEDGEYIPGHARLISLVIQVAFFLLVSLYTFVIMTKTSGKGRLHYRTIGLAGLAMTVFIILQAMYPFLPFYAIGCLIANCLLHTFIEVDEKLNYHKQIGEARALAFKDPLTGVKSTHAYVEAKRTIDHDIRDGIRREFGVVVFDINNLKMINDTLGHDEGDEFIKEACRMICEQFKHSPVFRTGGDEFVTILEGSDYEEREDLIRSFEEMMNTNRKKGNIVIASGSAVYDRDNDGDFDVVFQHADRNMYERKKALKKKIR